MTVTTPQNVLPATGLAALSLRAFRTAMPDCDVYVRFESNAGLKLYRRKGHPLAPGDIDRLAQAGVDQVWIGAHELHNRVRDRLAELEHDDLPRGQRFRIWQDLQRASFDAVYSTANDEEVTTFLEELGDQLSESVSRDQFVLGDLFSLMEHDDSTYTHSLNVASYALLLARALGWGGAAVDSQIATGGLLHDIGKRYVHLRVLQKPGPLTEDERKQIRNHPTNGFRDLFTHADFAWSQLMMVYQHHEKANGSGYPVGLVGDEIHPWARICAVADIFHALTSHRSYRQPMLPREAAEYLAHQAGQTLEKEIVRCWISEVLKIDPQSKP